MSRIEVFISPRNLFRIISDAVIRSNAVLIFQRFETEHHSAGFTVVNPRMDAYREYIDGEYRTAYISLGEAPKTSTDWSFIDREEEKLIEITGARQLENDISITKLRLVSKNSDAKKLFNAIKSEIIKSCKRGVLLNGHLYPKIYYEKGLDEPGIELWADIDTKTIKAEIADTA